MLILKMIRTVKNNVVSGSWKKYGPDVQSLGKIAWNDVKIQRFHRDTITLSLTAINLHVYVNLTEITA